MIVTHNRSNAFGNCLRAIASQVKRDDQIIIVDNASTADERHKNYTVFNRLNKGTITYHYRLINSIPLARNDALARAKKDIDILVFVDDDCVVQKHWLKNIKQSHFMHPGWHAIQGGVTSVPRNNFYAQLSGANYKNWLLSNRNADKTLSALDTKNISFKSEVFKTGVVFNKEVTFSSDIDFGMRLRKKGFVIGYDPSISVYHLERTTLTGFLLQHVRISKGEQVVGIGFLPDRYKLHLLTYIKEIRKHIFNKKLLYVCRILVIFLILFCVRGVFFARALLRRKFFRPHTRLSV